MLILAHRGASDACLENTLPAFLLALQRGADGVEHRHVLEVVEAGGKLTARERYNDGEPVEVQALKADGREVGFSVRRGDRNSVYSGKLADAEFLPLALAMGVAYSRCSSIDPHLPPELLPRPWPGRAARDVVVRSRRLALLLREDARKPALFSLFDDVILTLR